LVPLTLVLLPGMLVFLAGLVYGLVDRRRPLRAARVRLMGLAIMLGLPAIYVTYLIVTGQASPVGLLGVATMVGFAIFYLYLARHIGFPPGGASG